MAEISVNEAKIYNTKRGCVLVKNKFEESEIEDIKKQLTVKPNMADDYGQNIDEIKVFLENKNKLYIPNFWTRDNLKKYDITDNLPKGIDIDIKFNGSLRDNQQKPINATIKQLNEYGGGILCLSCGAGKTVLALNLISQIKKKVLIIVHKDFLVGQWKERIEQFLPDARIGLIQADKIIINDCDIVIGMLQSISQKKYPLTTFDSFGFTIIDECHRIPCKVFSKALFKINSNFMLGLTATPNRKDGLIKILKWHIGPIFYKDKNINNKTNVVVERYKLQNNDFEIGKKQYYHIDGYTEEHLMFNGKVNRSKMISELVLFKPRIDMISNLINDLHQIGRKTLILSDRIQHLKDIYKNVDNGIKKGYYIGGMKEEALSKTAECDLIFGSFSMAQEGMDIDSLNTIILASPKTDIEQAVGRIFRKSHEQFYPLIIDIIDDFSVFKGQCEKRNKFYKSKNYVIHNIHYSISGNVILKEEDNYLEKKNKKKNNSNNIDDNDDDNNSVKNIKKKCMFKNLKKLND